VKTLLKKIANDEDLKASGFNFTVAYLAGKFASMASSALFGFNLNQYNSIDHFALGVGIGTFTYRKAGRGAKGVLAGLAAATLFNAAWEGFEKGFNPYHNPESIANSISDIAVVYAGTVLSFLGEKAKTSLNQ
jgi:hypothetical protein